MFNYCNKKTPQNVLDTDIALDVVKGFGEGVQSEDSLVAENDIKFRDMIEKLLPSFEQGYKKLMTLIDSYFIDIEEQDDRLLGMSDLEKNHGLKKNTPNILFGKDKKWLDLYYRKIHELEKNIVFQAEAF